MSEQQPGFVDAFSQNFAISPSETALIVIDMQNATGTVSYTHLTLPTTPYV